MYNNTGRNDQANTIIKNNQRNNSINNTSMAIQSVLQTNRGLNLPPINKDVPLNKAGTIMAHNVNASTAYGAIFPNQYKSITELLNEGFRAFQLTVTDAVAGTSEPVLIHGFNQDANTALKYLFGSDLTFSGALNEIKTWQDAHPKEAVILNLQVFNARDSKLLGQHTKEAVNSVFSKESVYHNNGDAFETLRSIEEDGKQLVIFSQNSINDNCSIPLNHLHSQCQH